MKRLKLILIDLKYFVLIMLMFLLVAICFIPLKILSLFFGDKFTKLFFKFFELFDS